MAIDASNHRRSTHMGTGGHGPESPCSTAAQAAQRAVAATSKDASPTAAWDLSRNRQGELCYTPKRKPHDSA